MKCKLEPGTGVKTQTENQAKRVIKYIASCGISDGSLKGNSPGSLYGLIGNGTKAYCGSSGNFEKIISFEEFEKLISLPEIINYDAY